jgi:hypothetical protein
VHATKHRDNDGADDRGAVEAPTNPTGPRLINNNVEAVDELGVRAPVLLLERDTPIP